MIGDVLTSSTLAKAVKQLNVRAEVHYLIDDNTMAVVANNPDIDRLILMSPDLTGNKWRLLKLIRSIRAERYDIVIDAYCKISSNLIAFFSGADMTISKYKWYSFFFYSNPVRYSSVAQTNAGLAIENRLKLLQPMGYKSSALIRPKIYLDDKEVRHSKKVLDAAGIHLDKPLIMIGVLGSSDEKTYPFPYMAKALDRIVHKTSAQLLFNYIPKQKEQALEIYSLCQQETRSHIYIDIFGKSLREFLSLTDLCDALIGNEGGAINMAKALDIPTFTIFSPWIDKREWSMFDDGNRHRSVHLEDFRPSHYEDLKRYKTLKNRSSELYKLFEFELFSDQLDEFLDDIKAEKGAQKG